MNKKFLYLALPAFMLAACSNDEVTKTTNETLAQIRLSAQMEATLTRAADNVQEESINPAATPGVYVYKAGETSSTVYKYENNEVTAVSGEGGLTTSRMYYPQDKGAVDVYVYAPREDTSPSLTAMPITVATDQSTVAGYLASDFIYGEASNQAYPTGTPSAIEVTLKHALCKITLTINNGAGSTISDGDVKEVILGHEIEGSGTPDRSKQVWLKATIDLTKSELSQSVTTASSSSDPEDPKGTISFADTDDNAFKKAVSAVIPPQTATDIPLRVKIGSADYNATLSSPDGGFTAGNEYKYTVNVDAKTLTVKINSIADWGSGSSVDPISVQ